MRLDMAELVAFAAVIDEGSFDSAAKRLHVTPSAVSQRVKSLESKLGQVLVRRTRPTQATEAGVVLVRLAGQITLLEGDALAVLDNDRGDDGRAIRLSVAVNADSLATWFLPVLAEMPRNLATVFDVRHEDYSAELLRNGTVMAALTADERSVQGCSVECVGAMRYLGVASPAFVRRYLPNGTAPAALAKAPMLAYDRKDVLQHRFVRAVAGHPAEPLVTYMPSSWGLVSAARHGLAWGMLPEDMAKASLLDGQLVEIAPGQHLDVPLFWQRWRLDSPTLDALTASVRNVAARTLRQPRRAGSSIH